MIVVREDVIFSFLLFFWQQDIYVLLFFDFPLYNKITFVQKDFYE